MILSFLVLLPGCTTTIRFPPDLWGNSTEWWQTADTGWFVDTTTGTDTPGESLASPQVTRVIGDCDAEANQVDFTSVTDGWSARARLAVLRRADMRRETHEMDLVDLDPGGGWDRWQVVLADDAEPAKWSAGTTTGFDCSDAGQLTWAILLSADGPDSVEYTVDCVVWGADPGVLAAQVLSEDEALAPELISCRVMEP